MNMHNGLYDPSLEHDSCGVGFVAHLKNKPSHDIVKKGLTILENMTHRGATGYDPLLGDGAGILTQMPDEFFRIMTKPLFELPKSGDYACGNVFLPQDKVLRIECENIFENIIKKEGQFFLGWRDVPRNSSGLAKAAKDIEPTIKQVFIGRGKNTQTPDEFERKLFVIRKTIEIQMLNKGIQRSGKQSFYLSSLSSKTIVYKGMLLAHQVDEYYLDLKDNHFSSAIALVHQRFSTNTFPTWDLAQPFRMIAHNGEINTLRGNVNWMHARQHTLSSCLFSSDLDKLWPLIADGQSDTASFDNALELLVLGGYQPAHAMMMLIPEAWENDPLISEKRKAFYEFHAPIMEPWDGPAGIVFTNGNQIGATLDRNGLRPARYFITKDDLLVLSSESGTLPIEESRIVKKWRLQPGKMLLIDLDKKNIIDDELIKDHFSDEYPYQEWIKDSRVFLKDLPLGKKKNPLSSSLNDHQAQSAFGWTDEDLKFILEPMTQKGEEAIGSMGTDTALAVLSSHHKSLYGYFQQNFAQVTNPPIDPIREKVVMSLTSFIGPRPNLFGIIDDNEGLSTRLEVSQPILREEGFAKLIDIERLSHGSFKPYIIDICYEAHSHETAENIIQKICLEAEKAVEQDGFNLLILSDRAISADRVPVPALLACSAVHHHLVRHGYRTNTGIVVDSGSIREVHHVALLAGYGAEAVCPWLIWKSLPEITAHTDTSVEQAEVNVIQAFGKGLLKIMSKMGISTYQSYCGAQIFEAIGLNSDFLDRYFSGTLSRVEGAELVDILGEAKANHEKTFHSKGRSELPLDLGGEYAFRAHGEDHLWTPDSIAKLQHAVRSDDVKTYQEYAALINDQSKRHMTFRGLFKIKNNQPPIDINEVEPAQDIVKRFATGAMSMGSISTEAHTNLAVAMNRIGGKSNTGEGGEDPARFQSIHEDTSLAKLIGESNVYKDISLKKGDSLRSAIKQVASGRFGVTANYLSQADQIQIKMAQGAKPGEGGQLPGHKVSSYIGFLRYSVPGVGLISPPPHHDIYSIEDLAQLIHDLKNANPKASISVKLVSETGVGTVAAGVAKCKADHIVIAGFDGGTGASPLSSIKHAGTAWELGLSETQQTLVKNRLRTRVRLQVDGQIKTGRDVIVGALLGADEFGFATAPLVASGCIMMRKCHLNTCPVGIATQDPVLRQRFAGLPEHVINFFFFVAEEVRQWMAKLGVRKFDDLIGKSEWLNKQPGITHWKAKKLDFSRLLSTPELAEGDLLFNSEQQDHGLKDALDHSLIKDSLSALESKQPVSLTSKICNANRTVGTMLSYELTKRHGRIGLNDDAISIGFSGTAGQSFGAFLAQGITFELTGEGNDYVGKGLSGGKIIIKPSRDFVGSPKDNIIAGNTLLYGATSGYAFMRGIVGERFCVRNSGATAVVEGCGDHGCEYMTGGTVIVLGETGRNFAAGMSGGVAYVYDPKGTFKEKCNLGMVSCATVKKSSEQTDEKHQETTDEAWLITLIKQHHELTGSDLAETILDNWDQSRKYFIKVFPHEYDRALKQQRTEPEKVFV